MKTLSIQIKLCLMFLLVLSFYSCEKGDSGDIDPNTPIYQDYLVNYNKIKGTTTAHATFKENDDSGLRLVLSNGSEVRCNNEIGTYHSNVTNYFYRWDFEGFVDVNYLFTKNSSNVFNNTILHSEKEDIDLPNSFPPVYIDSSNVISWIGEPLKPREGIFYYVRQGSNSGGHSYISKTGITSFTIDAFHLNGLAPGEATLHILRETYLEGISESDGLNNGERIIQVETEKTFVING